MTFGKINIVETVKKISSGYPDEFSYPGAGQEKDEQQSIEEF